jgi:hypothetical protein
MKKLSFIAVIAALLFLISCNNETEKKNTKFSELAENNIKGDVASIEETPYQVDSTGQIGSMDSCCIVATEYNEDGNAVKVTEKDSKGTVKVSSVLERHENGLFKSITDTKNGKTIKSFETQLDDKGNFVGGQAYDSAGKQEFYYTGLSQNEYGQVMTWKQYTMDSVFKEEGIGTFDKNLQTGFTVKDSVGKVKFSNVNKYNDKGEQTESSATTVGKDSTTIKVMKYTYETHDEQGNWTQRTTWDDKGKAIRITKRALTYRNKEAKK